MTRADFDVIGIGNAIVDVVSHAEDDFLAANGIEKGAMTLIDAARAEQLYAQMGPGLEISGGSAANTMAGLASLGGAAAYVGKVRDDQLGAVFAHDIRAAGVSYTTLPTTDGAATARCLIVVTPDAQRSMNTFLGASVELGPEDIQAAEIAAAKVTYLEGYLWDPPQAKAAFRKAAALAHDAGRQVALSLSDAFCVHRHRAEFLELVTGAVDILFANETEILALFETTSFAQAVEAVRAAGTLAVLTRGAQGAVVVAADGVHAVPAEPVAQVVDTTGAGDLFAAGFLYGYTRSRPLTECARIGAIAAAEIISHVGARPAVSLASLTWERLG
jgi:sugar/nucleoside kinase (ribokinase family)